MKGWEYPRSTLNKPKGNFMEEWEERESRKERRSNGKGKTAGHRWFIATPTLLASPQDHPALFLLFFFSFLFLLFDVFSIIRSILFYLFYFILSFLILFVSYLLTFLSLSFILFFALRVCGISSRLDCKSGMVGREHSPDWADQRGETHPGHVLCISRIQTISHLYVYRISYSPLRIVQCTHSITFLLEIAP